MAMWTRVLGTSNLWRRLSRSHNQHVTTRKRDQRVEAGKRPDERIHHRVHSEHLFIGLKVLPGHNLAFWGALPCLFCLRTPKRVGRMDGLGKKGREGTCSP